jgi:hypothetical protein
MPHSDRKEEKKRMNMRNRTCVISLLLVSLLVVVGYSYFISSMNIGTSWTVSLGGNLHLYDSSMTEISSIDFGVLAYHGSVTWGGYISFEGNNGDCGLEIVLPLDDAYQFQADYVGPAIGSTPVGISIMVSDVAMQYGTPYSGVIVFNAIAIEP